MQAGNIEQRLEIVQTGELVKAVGLRQTAQPKNCEDLVQLGELAWDEGLSADLRSSAAWASDACYKELVQDGKPFLCGDPVNVRIQSILEI